MTGKYIERQLHSKIKSSLEYFKVTAILGPRQSGKSTLAQEILNEYDDVTFLDLETPSDLAKLDNPEVYFESQKGKLICLDEIQRRPDIFQVIRSVVDKHKTPGQFLILGSASEVLLKQSSETLAGRIEYLELTPFLISEIDTSFLKFWVRGGFPDSLLAPNDDLSLRWRDNFITTFLEKDIPSLGINISSQNLRRFWTMCAHSHGQIVNFSKIGQSLNLSHTTIQHYAHILSSTYVVRLLPPCHSNLKKRIVKSPKLYIRDSGLLHRLLTIDTFDTLSGHPTYGSSFEGLVIENILTLNPTWNASFYQTQSGAEIDLVLEKGTRKIAIECKATKAPKLQKGFFSACKDLDITEKYVISLVDETYKSKDNVIICNLSYFLKNLN